MVLFNHINQIQQQQYLQDQQQQKEDQDRSMDFESNSESSFPDDGSSSSSPSSSSSMDDESSHSSDTQSSYDDIPLPNGAEIPSSTIIQDHTNSNSDGINNYLDDMDIEKMRSKTLNTVPSSLFSPPLFGQSASLSSISYNYHNYQQQQLQNTLNRENNNKDNNNNGSGNCKHIPFKDFNIHHQQDSINSLPPLSSKGGGKHPHLSSVLVINVLICLLSMFEVGYVTSVISPTIPLISTIYQFNPIQFSTSVSIILIGGVFGSLASSLVVDRYGRRDSTLFMNLIFIVGAILCATTHGYAQLMIGRLISGLSCGAVLAIVPSYICEIAPPTIRGFLGSMKYFIIIIGMTVALLVGYGLVESESGWRLAFALAVIPPVIQLLCMYWFVESPRHLVHRGQVGRASDILLSLYPYLTRPAVEIEVEKIKDSMNEQLDLSHWKSIFNKQVNIYTLKYKKIFAIGFGISMLQSLSGINLLVYYITTILQDIGFSYRQSILVSALVGLPQLLAILLSAVLIDRYGRKNVLLVSLYGMTIGMAIIGYAFIGVNDEPEIHDDQVERLIPISKEWLAVGAIVFTKIAFSLGLGPIPTIITSEMFPSCVRGTAMAISGSLLWITNFLVSIVGVSLTGLLLLSLFLPFDTQKQTLEDLYRRLILRSTNLTSQSPCSSTPHIPNPPNHHHHHHHHHEPCPKLAI
ncbi:hypothetical protein DFA_09486 [Cavenderia fasciculata]|uniref:Major facilitator superfamily (MFS) profile domain-containing protein n=1 Tax=Cavenderia fasciculata TaxID=261658 RepID=F4Q7R7_CACFS|nr:uncharacterized protein DFA_09486 [Cavenderia fasciculata]EGG15817.1 hypothetical protein DFA_09486 [Cavenderia fasciculata]|eukprot:XP_004352142.1 hypothetical protein DFA_09486 [Cavenderia fasciculata]